MMRARGGWVVVAVCVWIGCASDDGVDAGAVSDAANGHSDAASDDAAVADAAGHDASLEDAASADGGFMGDGGALSDATLDASDDAAFDAGEAQCPRAEPTANAACEGAGLCTYGDYPGCRKAWECFKNHFTLVADVGCVGPSLDLCPLTKDAAQGLQCSEGNSCVYEDGTVCSCTAGCGGAVPPPEAFHYGCALPTRAVCFEGVPNDGDACPEVGVVCGSDCCGPRWECMSAGWNVTQSLCPP
jgi:hypothetical protein